MQIKFEDDIIEEESADQAQSTRVKKRFRININASFVVDDDEFVDVEWKVIPEDDLPKDGYGDVDEDACEAMGVEYFCDEGVWARPRNIQEEPITVQELMAHLVNRHESTLDFIEQAGHEDKLRTFVHEVDDQGRPVGQARNNSEAS